MDIKTKWHRCISKFFYPVERFKPPSHDDFENILVIVSFYRVGAILVGTPSAQAPNSFGSTTGWRLDNTRIEGQAPVIAANHFPDDPKKAHVLPVDYPLTYERLVSCYFDPNAEYLYALELP